MIHLNNIIEAISIKLFELVGCKIYMEEVKQGLKTPCFFISHLNTSKTELLNSRAKRANTFEIMYIPLNGKQEINNVLDALLDGLKFVTDTHGNIYHGINMSSEVVDNVLHLQVNYNYTTIEQTVRDSMESVSITQGVRNEEN